MSDDRLDDLKFKNEAAAGDEVDPAYAEMFGGGLGDEESEVQVGFDPVPPFDHYLLKPLKALPLKSQEKGTPYCRPVAEVIEGPEGTVGRQVWDSGGIFFIANPTKTNRKTGEVTELSSEDFEKKKKALRGLLLRIQRRLGLSLGFPTNFDEDGLEAYASQFTNGANDFIAAVRNEKGNDQIIRNRIVWQSIRGYDDVVKDSPGKTAVMVAREKIEAYNKRGKRSAGSSSRQFLR